MTFTPGLKVAVFVMTLGAAALAADLMWMVPGRIPVQKTSVTAPASEPVADTSPAVAPARNPGS